MWIEIEYKDYSYSENPTICHAIIDSDMITEFHIEDKTIKGHADLYYELTDDCFDCLMRNLNAGKYAVKMYGENVDIDDYVDKLCKIKPEVPTHKLVEELAKRKGVIPVYVAPYDTVNISREGPCTVLIVED